MKKIFAILAMALMAATAVAQEYRYEVGPALGVSGYIGDISSGNISTPALWAAACFATI